MPYVLFILAIGGGGVAGFCVAWYIKNKELAMKDQELALEKRTLDQREIIIEKLEDRFKAVASDVLRLNRKDFLEDFERARREHNADLETKEKGIERIVERLSRSMETADKKLVEFENQRREQVGELGASIKHVVDVGTRVQEAALTLTTALSSSGGVRGPWGEGVLQHLLEECGLTEGIHFYRQKTITGDDETSLRPDVIINLPEQVRLAIDSKASLAEFLKAVEENDPAKKKEHMKMFAQHIRTQITKLSSKEYQKHLDARIPYVIMFIPGKAAVRAVFEQNTNLYREAQGKKVMLASPATIMPLLLLITHAWKQHKTVENASKLAKEMTDLGSRLKAFFGHVLDIGSHLAKATEKFNAAGGSWSMKVLPKIQQINTLGGNMHQIDMPIQTIEVEPRAPGKLLTPTDEERTLLA
jgi:DNA recombination protein RmuC